MTARGCAWDRGGYLAAGLAGQGRAQRFADTRGLPRPITVDQGPEFEGQVLDSLAYEAGVQLSFIRPGKPNENAYIESFNGKYRV
jgi:putative transposase